MADASRKSAPPDPHTLSMAATARREVKRHRWSRAEFAARLRRSQDQVKRLLYPRSANGRRHWDADDIFDVAGVLGLSVEELAGRHASGTTFWDPRIDPADILANRFAEHQDNTPTVLTFNRIIPCSVMLPVVQRQHYVSLFTDFLNDPIDGRFCDTYNEFANIRRAAFLANGTDTKLRAATLMLRSDFEKMIRRQPPFHQCSRQHIIQNLEFLRTECVRNRGFRMALIDDKKIPLQLYPRLCFDSVALVGDALRVERRADYLIECSETHQRVADAKSTLVQLESLVDFDTADTKTLRAEIERYMKVLEDELVDDSSNSG